jgi:hypothetical protein
MLLTISLKESLPPKKAEEEDEKEDDKGFIKTKSCLSVSLNILEQRTAMIDSLEMDLLPSFGLITKLGHNHIKNLSKCCGNYQ